MGWNHDPDGIHSHQSGEIQALTEKTTPVDADVVVIEDSEDSNKKKKVKVANLGGGAETLDDLTDVDTTGVADGDALVYDADTSTWVPGEGGSGGGASYAATIGDNTNTSFQVTHGLGTEDLVVQLWDLTGSDPVEATGDADSITVDDEDNITVAFSAPPATDSYRVVVLSDGGTSSGGGGGGGVFEGVANNGTLKAYSLPGLSTQSKGSATIGLIRWYVPITVQESIHVVNLVAEVTTGAAGGRAMRVGLYESTFHLIPGALVAEGEIDASSTGIKTVAVNETISAGRYLLAFQSNHGSTGYRFVRYAHGNLVNLGTSDWGRLGIDTAYGAMPDPGLAWDSFNTAGTQPFSCVFLEVEAA